MGRNKATKREREERGWWVSEKEERKQKEGERARVE